MRKAASPLQAPEPFRWFFVSVLAALDMRQAQRFLSMDFSPPLFPVRSFGPVCGCCFNYESPLSGRLCALARKYLLPPSEAVAIFSVGLACGLRALFFRTSALSTGGEWFLVASPSFPFPFRSLC